MNDDLLLLLKRYISETHNRDDRDTTIVNTLLEYLDKPNALSVLTGSSTVAAEMNASSSVSPMYEWKDSVGLIDPETGLKSRRCFDLILSTEVEKARARGIPLTVILMDFPQLRVVKSKHGSIAVAELVRWISGRITSTVRGRDIVGRFGSHEFVVLLSMTNGVHAETVVRNIQTAFDDCSWTAIGSTAKYRIAPVVGIAEYASTDTSGTLIRRLEEDLSLARYRTAGVARSA